ncbi:MAG: Rpn family recombination-promoting nuclease/putative transposase [Treponema sp.]
MEKRTLKDFQDLTFQDDFMFCKVLQNMNICKRVLELVLEEELSIKNITSQKTIENYSESKLVRLDVLAEDEKENKFNIEMQMVNNDKIPQRMRLYQASIDVYMTEKGTFYADMPNTVIIFFCMFDPIGERLPVYTFKNICEQDKNIKLNDGTAKIIINVKAYEKVKNLELKGLMKYICDGIVTNSLTKEIEMTMSSIKQNTTFLKEYKSFYATMQDAKIEGMKEGIYTKAIETAKKLIAMNLSIEQIAQATGLSIEEIAKL